MSAGPVGRFVVVPAVYLYLLRDGVTGTEVLLQLRGRTGFMDDHWAAAAAGHVERGETALDAVAREAAEEVGVREVGARFLTTMQRTGRGEPVDERVDFFFTARSWVGEPRVLEPAKCQELRWCPLTALPEPLVPHEREVLEGLARDDLPAYVTHGFEPAEEIR